LRHVSIKCVAQVLVLSPAQRRCIEITGAHCDMQSLPCCCSSLSSFSAFFLLLKPEVCCGWGSACQGQLTTALSRALWRREAKKKDKVPSVGTHTSARATTLRAMLRRDAARVHLLPCSIQARPVLSRWAYTTNNFLYITCLRLGLAPSTVASARRARRNTATSVKMRAIVSFKNTFCQKKNHPLFFHRSCLFRQRLRLRTDIFKSTKSNPGSMEITKTEGLLCFDLWLFQPK